MRIASAAIIACLLIVAAPVQARSFADLQTDLTAAPYRAVTAIADFHPLVALSASMRRGMASWDEFTMRAEDAFVIGWGRLVLGADEVRSSADRGLVTMLGRIFAEPVPRGAATAAIGESVAQPPSPAPDPAGVRWVNQVERLFRSSP